MEQLNKKLAPLFRMMEAEYIEKDKVLSECELINKILIAAKAGVGTCIDKVKVGYLFMQIFAKKGSEVELNTLETIINTVEDIGSYLVVFDTSKNEFINVARTILNGDFSADLKLQANYLLQLSGNSAIDLTDEEIEGLNQNGTYTMTKNDLAQHLTITIQGSNTEIEGMRIGDEVEDILMLAYELLGDDFHKIDMNYACCCTLKDFESGFKYKEAAIDYINKQICDAAAT